MIIFKSKTSNIDVSFGGTIKINPRKIGFNKVETIYGENKVESIRLVIDLEVNIEYLDDSDYYKLMVLFGGNCVIDIEDLDTGDYYTDYMIDGDVLSLERKEDIKQKRYYHKGSIRVMKL
ncbi:MAG: hypothetical protein ACRCRT_04600 [Cetobacterium somerae]